MGEIARELGFTQVSLSSEVMPMVRIVPRGYTGNLIDHKKYSQGDGFYPWNICHQRYEANSQNSTQRLDTGFYPSFCVIRGDAHGQISIIRGPQGRLTQPTELPSLNKVLTYSTQRLYT